jgi:hypothetical protein
METSPTLTPPARKMFGNRFFTWRVMRKVLFVLAALITLGALFFAEEEWRGSHAWASYKRDMEAKGEHFEAARLIPAKVSDDQNFTMTPYFAPLFDLPPEVLREPVKFVTNMVDGDSVVGVLGLPKLDTNLGTYFEVLYSPNLNPRDHPSTWPYALAADLMVYAKACEGTNSGRASVEIADPAQAASIILDYLKPTEPTLAELHQAAARPYSQFNIPWEEWDNQLVQAAVMQHLVVVKTSCRFLSLHAQAEMVLGRTGQALDDLNVMFRIDDGLKGEPLLISQLVRLAYTPIMLQSVGEGLAEHRWSEAQLQVLQERLRNTDLLASTVLALYGERDICINPKFEQGYMRPRGWNRLEQLNLNRAINETVLPRIVLAHHEISPSVDHSMNLIFQSSYPTNWFSALFHHYIMASMMLPAYAHVGEKVAFAQSEVDMAMLACALERYRLAQGQYPNTLDALVPRFAPTLPHDINNGQPLKYRLLENGRFILYSVGWNEKDDGGVVAATKGTTPRQDRLQGDWVFQYPENP